MYLGDGERSGLAWSKSAALLREGRCVSETDTRTLWAGLKVQLEGEAPGVSVETAAASGV